MADLVTEHPLDFVAHGFAAGGAEMNRHPVCGVADLLHKRSIGSFLSAGVIVAAFLLFMGNSLLKRKCPPSAG